MSASMARISHRATATLTSRTTCVASQGPGKVAIRPVYPMTPHRGPAPRDCVGPGREPDSSDRHGRTYGADRDFAGALRGLVPRGLTLEVEHQDIDGQRRITVFQRAVARLVAHEINHLNGILYTERMRPGVKPIPVTEYEGTGRQSWTYS